MHDSRNKRRAKKQADRDGSNYMALAINDGARRTAPPVLLALTGGFLLGAVSLWFIIDHLTNLAQIAAVPLQVNSGPKRPSIAELVAMPDEELAKIDLAVMSLVCAHDLPRENKNTIEESLALFDQIADSARAQTENNFHRWLANPSEYENSEAFYRVGMMWTVIGQDFNIRYNPNKIAAATIRSFQDMSFFDDADDVLITGCLGATRQGTCASMPVLAVAVARRLGYPLKLVSSKGHLFCRWEGAKERRNFELTNAVSSQPDDYYRKFPFPIEEWELQKGWYLKSLTPREELAVCLSSRAAVLQRHKRYGEALLVQAQINLLCPGSRDHGAALISSAEAVFKELGFVKSTDSDSVTRAQNGFNADEHFRQVTEINAANASRSRGSSIMPFSHSARTPESPFPTKFNP